jgi:hypothetical protein
MAKELPYFKFEPNQWENGNIQILTRDQKGLFIDLCSIYWSRVGELSHKLAIQKLCNGNATALDLLYEEQIIEVIEGNIFIKFLSEQLNEFEDKNKQNSINAKEGWQKRRKQKEKCDSNATASIPQCENDGIIEYNIKEDNIRKDNKSLKKEKTEKVFSEDIKLIYEKSLSFFSENLHPKNPNDWMKCIDELIRIDKIPAEIILEATQRARSDSFWNENFLSLTKLRKKNPEGIQYIVVFYEKFLKQKQNGINKTNNGKGVTDDELARTLHEHFIKQREQNGSN